MKPLDVISKLMFSKWTYEDNEADLTVVRITVIPGQADQQSAGNKQRPSRPTSGAKRSLALCRGHEAVPTAFRS